MLLVTWFLAGVVGIITALLVKSPGEKQARRATQPSRRDLSPVVWPAIFPMLFFLLTLPGVLPLFDVSLPVPVWARLSYCLFAVFVSGMTVLIVTIRGSKPRFEKPLQVWGVFIPAVLFIPLVLLPGPGSWLLAGFMSIMPALLVRVRGGDAQADRATEPPQNGASPKMWIIVAPVLFLVFCMQFEFIILPDYNDFGQVLISWLLTGLASLIILLALKLGSREKTGLPAQEALQLVQVQG